MKSTLITIGVIVAALVGVSWLVTAEAALALMFGWTSFLQRVAPRMTVYWPSAVVGVTAFFLLFVGVHLFGRSFPRAAAADGTAARSWKFRWTASLVLIVVVAFAAGISMIGVVHQIGWLATSEQPLLGEAIEPYCGADARNSMKMIGLGMLNYESAFGRFPSANGPVRDMKNPPNFSWETQIGPFNATLAFPGDPTKTWNDPVNQRYFKCVIPVFINPSFRTPQLADEEGYGLDHYSANERVIGADTGMRVSDIGDGTSSTILFGEVSAGFSPWGRPGNVRDPAKGIHRDGETFGGPPMHGGTYFMMADGSTRMISDDVDPAVLKALSTPADGDNPQGGEAN